MGAGMRLANGDLGNRRAARERPGEDEPLAMDGEAQMRAGEFEIAAQDQVAGLQLQPHRADEELRNRRPGETLGRTERQQHQLLDIGETEPPDQRICLLLEQHRALVPRRIMPPACDEAGDFTLERAAHRSGKLLLP